MMVDAAYEELYRSMRPGMRENECVGLVNKVLYDLGSEHVEGVNAISGERANPHPHVYTDRVLRPGDPAYFDILHSYMGYRTCYYRTFAVGSASRAAGRRLPALPRPARPGDRRSSGPGATTAEVAAVWPRAQEFGFADEEAAFALQFGHGVGLSIWEKPIISRLVSLDHPEVIEEGMVFALETFWPATDGWSAARIEEQLVVTADGCEVITRFPAEDLLVAGRSNYFTVGGQLPGIRETQSHLNRPAADAGPRRGGAAVDARTVRRGLEHERLRRRRRVLDPLQQQLGGPGADLAVGDVDGGERRREAVGERHVVEADHRDVPGAAQARPRPARCRRPARAGRWRRRSPVGGAVGGEQRAGGLARRRRS